VALAARSHTTVSAHIIAQLSGPFQQYHWANSEMRFNAQGELTHLRSVVMSPLAKLLYESHKGLWYVRAMDASFGFCRANIEVFIVMWVHPVINKGLPLATFLRRQGTGEAPLAKTDDLVWCEQQLEVYFKVAPAAVTFVDKDAASLKAHTVSLANTWQRVAAAPLPAPLPAPAAVALPAAAAAAAGGALADAPGAALAGGGGGAAKEGVPLLLETAADVSRALQAVAAGCSLHEANEYSAYMAQLCSVDFFKAATVEVAPPRDDGPLPAATCGLFGQWGASYPRLVRPRAHAMDAALQLALEAVKKAAAGSVQDMKDALSNLRVHCFALADTPLASFVSVCVLRDIVLCYFHAKKAMSEWNTSHQGVPKDAADLWATEVKPAIDSLFAASREDLDSEWARFKDRFQPLCGAFVEYMSVNWMSPKWRYLWTKAGRYDLAHLMLETTNVCELFFRVMKGNVLQWQMPTDLVVFFRKLYGLPLEPGSQEKSYLYSLYLELVAVYRGLKSRTSSSVRLPARKHVDPAREHFSRIVALKGSVRSAGAPGFVLVANTAGRELLERGSAPSELLRDHFHAVSLFHDKCSCAARESHCKHVMAARFFVLSQEDGPGRTWLDPELSMFFPYEHSGPPLIGPAAMAKMLSSADDDVDAPVTPAAAAASLAQLHPAILASSLAALSAVQRALSSLAIAPPPAAQTDVVAALKTVKAGGALVTALNKVATYAKAVDGNPAPGLGGARLMPARALPGQAAAVAAAQRRLSPLQMGLAMPGGGGGGGGALHVDAGAGAALRILGAELQAAAAAADGGGGGAAAPRPAAAAPPPRAAAPPPPQAAAARPALQLANSSELLLARIKRRDAKIRQLNDLLDSAQELVESARELLDSAQEAHETSRASSARELGAARAVASGLRLELEDLHSEVAGLRSALAEGRKKAHAKRAKFRARYDALRAQLEAKRAKHRARCDALRAQLEAARVTLASMQAGAGSTSPLKRGRH